jgi:hypothetical protein
MLWGGLTAPPNQRVPALIESFIIAWMAAFAGHDKC